MNRFERPSHKSDDNKAHIDYGQDPLPILKQHGYCVVENVFSKNECTDTIVKMWDWLEGLKTGINRKDITTWSNKNWPISMRQGMIQNTLAHEEFMWEIREHPNVLKIYEQIFKTNKLLTSFDGAMIGRPPETKYVTSPKQSWLHTDQNLIPNVYDSNYYSIQGIANFETVEDEDGSLFIGEGSHLYHREIFDYNKKKPKGNWYVFTKNDIDWFHSKSVQFVKVNAPAGSVILFDSRCAHQGYPAQKNRANPKLRYVIYLAYTPAKRATQKDYNKKIKAIKEGRCTSHWSSNNIKLFGKPRTYGKEMPEYITRPENIKDPTNWSNARKLLSGINKY